MRRPAGCGWRLVGLYEGILVVEQSLIRRLSCQCFATPTLGPNFVRRAVGETRSNQSAGRIKFLHLHVNLLNLHLQQVPNPYLLGARKRWMRVNCIERIGIWPVLKLATDRKSSLRLSISVMHLRLNKSKWVSPLILSQNKLDSVVGCEVSVKRKIYSIYGVLK